MSIDTWHKDWVESPDYKELKLEDEIRLYEKFVDRIEDVISAYDDEDNKDIIKDLEYEVENLKEGLEEV